MPETFEPVSRRATELQEAFWEQVEHIPNGHKIKSCLQCGTCTGSCPVSYMMDITPREIVALFRAGQIEKILHSRTIWICASCYSCRVRCPQGILVTDLLYALKRLAINKKIYPAHFPVYALSQVFIRNVYRYGRNFELGLGIHYLLKAAPTKLLGGAGFGLAMLKRGRLGIKPKTIKKIEEVRAIIDRANKIEGV